MPSEKKVIIIVKLVDSTLRIQTFKCVYMFKIPNNKNTINNYNSSMKKYNSEVKLTIH